MKKKPLLLGITGYPLLYTRSPRLHRGFMRKRAIKGRYDVLPFNPAEGKARFFSFLDGLRERGYCGINVTIPHKEWAYEYSLRLGRSVRGFSGRCAARVGAVNTLVFSRAKVGGANTDAEGFWNDAKSWLDSRIKARGSARLVIVGTGGSARGVLAGLLERHEFARRFCELRIEGRDRRKVAALRKLVPGALLKPRHEEMSTLVVWCLPPLGKSAARAVFEKATRGLQPGSVFIYDLNYGERADDTKGLVAGSRRRTGMGMLRGQAAAAFSLWQP